MLRRVVIAFGISLAMLPQALAFTDMTSDDLYYPEAHYLQEQGVVSGYPDGSFQPAKSINRAEFLKLALLGNQDEISVGESLRHCEDRTQQGAIIHFSDIPLGEWYTPYVCAGVDLGYIQGYDDGTFKPDQSIAFSEAAKIVSLVFKKSVAPGDPWYQPYLDAMEQGGALPPTYDTPGFEVNRGEMAYMITHLLKGDRDYANLDPRVAGFYDTGILEVGHVKLQWYPKDAKRLQDPLWMMDKFNNAYNAYVNLTGYTPLGGDPVTFQERCAYVADSTPDLTTCPNGMMEYDTHAHASTPVALDEFATDRTIGEANTQHMDFGLLHEMSHVFDEGDNQYIFDSTTTEAWADTKVSLILDDVGAPADFYGTVFNNGEDLINIRFKDFYQAYLDDGNTFQDIYTTDIMAHALGQRYSGIIDHMIHLTSEESLSQTLHIYKTIQNIRPIPKYDRIGRMNQFVLFWSAMANKDLTGEFEQLHFPILPETRSTLFAYLSLPLEERTPDRIVELDRQYNTFSPATSILSAFNTKAVDNGLSPSWSPMLRDGVWIEPVLEGTTNLYLVYNSDTKEVYIMPWWNSEYIMARGITYLGLPLGDFYYDGTSGWTQQFALGTLVYDTILKAAVEW